MVVLSWLTVALESFKQYVSNRVHQTQTVLPNCIWRHVSSADNPANCASRGLMPSELPSFSLYWHGPRFIYDSPDEWGSDRVRILCSELPEIRPVCCSTHVDEVAGEWFSRFSSYDRMLRVVVRMRRFIECCRRKRPRPCMPLFLSKSELDNAARIIVIESQRIHFAVLFRELVRGDRVSSKPLARLAPFIDSEGVIRVGGRLRHSLLVYDCKHPILVAILPS